MNTHQFIKYTGDTAEIQARAGCRLSNLEPYTNNRMIAKRCKNSCCLLLRFDSNGESWHELYTGQPDQILNILQYYTGSPLDFARG